MSLEFRAARSMKLKASVLETFLIMLPASVLLSASLRRTLVLHIVTQHFEQPHSPFTIHLFRNSQLLHYFITYPGRRVSTVME